MEMDVIIFLMVIITLANILMENQMDLDNINGLMEVFILANFKMD